MEPERAIQDLDFIENDLIARMAEARTFRDWWALRQQRSTLVAEREMLRTKSRMEKARKMSESELTEARGMIALYNKRKKTAKQIIKALSKRFGKLADEVDAARVYWTETKKADTEAVHEISSELGFTKYKVILSPSACEVCRKKTDGGRKVFKSSEITKSGYGHAPPFHPNCYCILVPHSD